MSSVKNALQLARLRNKQGPLAPIKVRKFASGGSVPEFDPNKPFEAAEAPAFDASKPFESVTEKPASSTPVDDHGLSERQKLSPIAKALSPITSYPETYSKMNKEAREQVGHGIDQLSAPEGAWDVAKGIGNTVAGAASYVASPVNAAYRSIVGQPVEDVTGIPREYTEFAAQLATPGIGLTSVGKGGPPLGSTIPKPAAAQSVPSADAIKGAAIDAYKAPEVAALKIHPRALSIFGEESAAALTKEGFDPLLAPKTYGLLEKATLSPEGTPFVTAANVQTIRKMLGKAAESTDKTERTAAQIAQRKLDEFMAKIPESAVIEGDAVAASKVLKEARNNYAAASRSERFQEALDQAERQASRAGMGGNLENATRQRITSILNSPSKSRGLSEAEKSAMNDYVSGNFTRNGLRVATKILGGDNPLMAAIHAGMAVPSYGLSLAAPLTGFALKKINNAMSAKEITKIDDLLRSRSPLAKQTEHAVSEWAKSGMTATKNDTAQTAARFIAAAESLASKLNASGIKPDMKQLMSPFQGAVPAAAQDEQQ